MLKNLLGFSILLTVIDLLITFIANILYANPGGFMIVSTIVAGISLIFLLLITGTIWSLVIKNKSKIFIIVTMITVYFLIPVVIYLLKQSPKDLLNIYIDLHTKLFLFSVTLLPYLIACGLSFFIYFRKVGIK
jgi:hypothetical protein